MRDLGLRECLSPRKEHAVYVPLLIRLIVCTLYFYIAYIKIYTDKNDGFYPPACICFSYRPLKLEKHLVFVFLLIKRTLQPL